MEYNSNNDREWGEEIDCCCWLVDYSEELVVKEEIAGVVVDDDGG